MCALNNLSLMCSEFQQHDEERRRAKSHEDPNERHENILHHLGLFCHLLVSKSSLLLSLQYELYKDLCFRDPIRYCVHGLLERLSQSVHLRCQIGSSEKASQPKALQKTTPEE